MPGSGRQFQCPHSQSSERENAERLYISFQTSVRMKLIFCPLSITISQLRTEGIMKEIYVFIKSAETIQIHHALGCMFKGYMKQNKQ